MTPTTAHTITTTVGRGCRMTPRITPFLWSAPPGTHDHSHVSRVAASGQRLPAGSSDLTRLERVRRAHVFDPFSSCVEPGGRLRGLTSSKLAGVRRRLTGKRLRHAGRRVAGTVGELSHIITRLVHSCVSFRNNASQAEDDAGQSLYRSRFAARRRSARLSPWG